MLAWPSPSASSLASSSILTCLGFQQPPAGPSSRPLSVAGIPAALGPAVDHFEPLTVVPAALGKTSLPVNATSPAPTPGPAASHTHAIPSGTVLAEAWRAASMWLGWATSAPSRGLSPASKPTAQPPAPALSPTALTEPPRSLPLLDSGLPDWSRISAATLPEIAADFLRDFHRHLDALEGLLASPQPPSHPDADDAQAAYRAIVAPVTALQRGLSLLWGCAAHLLNVDHTARQRAAHRTLLPGLLAAEQRLLASPAVQRRVAGLQAAPAVWGQLTVPQRRTVELLMQDARQAGWQLSGPRRRLLAAVREELARLGTEFSAHLQAGAAAWHHVVDDPRLMEGLPTSVLEVAAKEHTRATGQPATAAEGPWRLSLAMAGDVLCLAADRGLRRAVLAAVCRQGLLGPPDPAAPCAGRAGDSAPLYEVGNFTTVRDILTLRQLEAGLLGYASYADFATQPRMARSATAARRLLQDTHAALWQTARQEFGKLQSFATQIGMHGDLEPCDINYYATLYQRRNFNVSEWDVAEYFPFPVALEMVFATCKHLLGVDIIPMQGPAWHRDVRQFRVVDERTHRPLGYLGLDPFARPARKKPGAWTWPSFTLPYPSFPPERTDPGADAGPSLPVAVINLNIPCPPAQAIMAEKVEAFPLVPLDHLVTLFHEMGHAMQHLLTTCTDWHVAGVHGVPFDAIEVASQLFERFALHWPTVHRHARHYKTGAPLPPALWQRLLDSRQAFGALGRLRQVLVAAADLDLHHTACNPLLDFGPRAPPRPDLIVELYRRLAAQLSPEPHGDADSHAIYGATHLFDGSYGAAYYSYQWSEALASEYYAAFEAAGLPAAPLDRSPALRRLGRRLRGTLLGLGGSRDPTEVLQQFRGEG
eukprot:EG_transcript_2791